MKFPYMKSLLVCGGATGAGCAIGLPVSDSLQSKTTVVTGNIDNTHQASLPGAVNSIGEGAGKTSEYTFDQLGEEVRSKSLNQQGELLKQKMEINGIEDLKQVFYSEVSDLKLELKENSGKNCWRNSNGISTYCGYLNIESSQFQYKLKISYFKNVQSERDMGDIHIVRREKGGSFKNFYWSLHEKKGKEVNRISFDQLSSFENIQTEDRDEGSAIPEFSIKHISEEVGK